jgi:dihydroflavonol-4-reductase
MDEMDAVFHLAALVAPWIRDPREFQRVNVDGTRNMVDEALRAAVPRFIFTSSLSGIGVQPGVLMQEGAPPGRVFGPYEESKAAAERLVATYVREQGLPAITLIPSIVVGPGDIRNTGKFLLSFVRGEFPGTFAEDSVLPVVDVNDVVRAHILAYSRGRIGDRYIISGENVTWGEMLRMASSASGRPMPSRHIGDRSLWLASRAGELLARVRRSPPRLPAWLADFLLSGAAMDNTKSIRDLGMTYRPIQDSISEATSWFRQEGMLGPVAPRPASPLDALPVENPLTNGDSAADSTMGETSASRAAGSRRRKPPEGPP